MKHLKNFKLFESEVYSKLTPEMKKLADSLMAEITVIVETDKDKMYGWVIDKGLQQLSDEYLESDEFREFTEASVEETDDYRERVQLGEDPDEVLKEMTDEAVEDQTYWSEFLEDGGYEASVFDEIRGEVPYINPNKKEYLLGVESTWSEVQGTSFPTIDVEGSAVIYKYEGSFFPFRIREVSHGDLFPDDMIIDFQTAYHEDMTGELSIHDTRLIAWDKSTDVEWSFNFANNPRLISIEGVRNYDEISLYDNFLDEKILKKSIGLIPGSNESIEYYLSLFDLPEAEEFDEEQLEFIISRTKDLQKIINENPERMAVVLKPVWRKLKSMEQYKDIKFPKGLSDEADLLASLHRVGF
jgi:hypothetical protein